MQNDVETADKTVKELYQEKAVSGLGCFAFIVIIFSYYIVDAPLASIPILIAVLFIEIRYYFLSGKGNVSEKTAPLGCLVLVAIILYITCIALGIPHGDILQGISYAIGGIFLILLVMLLSCFLGGGF